MRIFLDQDVHPQVKELLEKKNHEVYAAPKGPSVKDEVHYEQAVRGGFDLVITCNAGKEPKAREGNFVRNVEEHLAVREKDFPVPVHELWEPGIGNKWPGLRLRWDKHERQIEHHARQIEHTNSEKRHAQAVVKLEEQLARAEELRRVEQGRGQEAGRKDRGHELD